MSHGTDIVPVPAWGHGRGLVALARQDPVAESEVTDRRRIVECMYRYAWSFDERQEELLASCFAPDVTWEASLMGETTIGPFVGLSEVMGFMTGFWPNQFDQRRHMIFNPVVTDLAGGRATLMTYHLLVSTTSKGVHPITTGFYRNSMVKEPSGEWRIHTLLAGYDVPF